MANANNPPGSTGVNNFPLIVRGTTVHQDEHGLVCLDDIWRLAKAKASRLPKKWRALPTSKRMIEALAKKVRNSALKTNSLYVPVIYAKPGRGNAGTFAHPVLAAAYAGYLDERLGIEIHETWLRARVGDPALADEILARASADANEWAGTRALGRARRRQFTDTLQRHGVMRNGYAACTDAIYVGVFGKPARVLKAERGDVANLRDNMETRDLAYLLTAETMASERIEETNPQGNAACAAASRRSAEFLRKAIEADRADRKKPAA